MTVPAGIRQPPTAQPAPAIWYFIALLLASLVLVEVVVDARWAGGDTSLALPFAERSCAGDLDRAGDARSLEVVVYRAAWPSKNPPLRMSCTEIFAQFLHPIAEGLGNVRASRPRSG